MQEFITSEGKFKSTKYWWCPEGFFALKLTDPIAQTCALAYAELTDQIELAEALRYAILEIQHEGKMWTDKQ